MNVCNICGKDMDMVGKAHRCSPQPVFHSETVVHKTGEHRYRDREARKAYKRQWMARNRAGKREMRKTGVGK
jgi:hypothetical protein